jgi:hypothetical protein
MYALPTRRLSPSNLTQNMNERCYKACVTKPGTSLSSSEQVSFVLLTYPDYLFDQLPSFQTCLARCLDRFMDACEYLNSIWMHPGLNELQSTLWAKRIPPGSPKRDSKKLPWDQVHRPAFDDDAERVHYSFKALFNPRLTTWKKVWLKYMNPN